MVGGPEDTLSEGLKHLLKGLQKAFLRVETCVFKWSLGKSWVEGACAPGLITIFQKTQVKA